MAIVLLRTLTSKSIIGFGTFTDITVQNLLDTFRYKELLEIYYNFRNIDYCQELKDILCIEGDRVINKREPNPDRFFKDAKKKIYACISAIIERKTSEQRGYELHFKAKEKINQKKRVSASQVRKQVTVFGKNAQRRRNQW
jgi:hypothetical protein